MTVDPPETPKGSGIKKEKDSPSSVTNDSTAASSSAHLDEDRDGLDKGNRGSEGEDRPAVVEDPYEQYELHIKGRRFNSLEEFESALEELGLQDCQSIELTCDGETYWEMGKETAYHVEAVAAIAAATRGATVPVYVGERGIYVQGSVSTKKYPDLAIYLGDDRLEDRGVGGHRPLKRFVQQGPKRARVQMHPTAIVEFSWSNKIINEITKFNEQMNNLGGADVAGQILFGVLIKSVPKFPNSYPKDFEEPNRDPDHEEFQKKPLIGFDVYIARAGEQVARGVCKSYRYRNGEGGSGSLGDEEGNSVIEITGQDLGQDGNDDVLIRIPLEEIRNELEDLCVRFVEDSADEDESAAAAAATEAAATEAA